MLALAPFGRVLVLPPLISLSFVAASVQAQDGGPPGPDAGVPPLDAAMEIAPDAALEPAPPSAQETAEIEAALAADRAETEVASDSPSTPAAAGDSRPNALNPEIAVIADFAFAVYSDEDHRQTGNHDPEATGFDLQQLEISLRAAVDPYFRFDSNLVFDLFSVEIEEAYATTLDLPLRLQARLGQFLTRFGRLNATHPHAWDFADQSFAIGRVFGPEGNRGLGAELSWLTPLPWFVEVIVSSTTAGARSFYGEQTLEVEGLLDFQHTAAIEQFFELGDDLSLLWGLSAAVGPNATGRDNFTELYGTDLYLKYRPITRASETAVSFSTEWIYRRRAIPRELLQDLNGNTQLVWQITNRWSTGARWEWGTPAYGQDGEVADETGDTSLDPLDPDWRLHRHRFSAQLTYRPTEFSRLRLQTSLDMFDWFRDEVVAVFLTAEIVAGAHGAHTF
jgi:hypothetical protein